MLVHFFDKNLIGYTELIFSIILFIYSLFGLLDSIKAWYLGLLGYSVFCFFDIYKSLILFNYWPSPSYKYTIIVINISLLVFIIGYHVFFREKKIYKKNTSKIHVYMGRGLIVTIPMLLLCIYYSMYPPKDNVSYLISFFPKAFLVLAAWYSIVNKRYFMLLPVFIGMYFVHTEISRRIYIVVFFMLVAVLQSSFKVNFIRLSGKHKIIISFLLASLFIFASYLRSDFNYGEGFVEGDRLQSTINYIENAKAVDVFENTDFVIDSIPWIRPYYMGQTYFAIFVQFIPRSFWKDKWVSFGAHLALLKRYGIKWFDNDTWKYVTGGFSYSTGFVGESYANFGLIGVLVMSLFFGVVARFFDKHIKYDVIFDNAKLFPIAAFYGAFFLVSRGDMLMATYFSILYFLFIKILIHVYDMVGCVSK